MANKIWNWLLKDWPYFKYNKEALRDMEHQFNLNNGRAIGVLTHLDDENKNNLLVEVLSTEAVKTSEIEGEILNRESVQSSIKRNFGLSTDNRKISPAEFGISEMMVDLYLNYDNPLSNQQLYDWHKMITNGRRDLLDIGRYRTHEQPMQIISGRLDKPNVHFEAPPSNIIVEEMNQFIHWFNTVHRDDDKSGLLPLAKAGMAHLYYVSIHPFEDGNGRIGRAIVEKSMALSSKNPTLISISHMIEASRKDYYNFLENHNKTLEITDWLVYFGKTILDAQENTLQRIDFIIEKTKFFDRNSKLLNERQLIVVRRVFEEGSNGFKGGLSAKNYQTIAKTSASTSTRDLVDLVEKQILVKTGLLKSTRYTLFFNEK